MMDSIFLDSLQLYGAGTDSNYVMKDFKGLGNPEPRADRSPRSRRHGEYDLTTYYGGRSFTGEMWIQADDTDLEDWDTFWTAYDAFMEAYSYGTPGKTLTFTRKGKSYSEYCEVTVDEGMEPEFLSPQQAICRIPFQVVAADPRIYVTTLQTLTFASAGNADNTGNFNTSPLIRFNGAGTDPGCTNGSLSTENQINIDYTMIGGDEIEVDCLARTVKLNGALRPDIIDMSTSSFWGLRSGVNALTKTGGAVSVEVEWNSARSG